MGPIIAVKDELFKTFRQGSALFMIFADCQDYHPRPKPAYPMTHRSRLAEPPQQCSCSDMFGKPCTQTGSVALALPTPLARSPQARLALHANTAFGIHIQMYSFL